MFKIGDWIVHKTAPLKFDNAWSVGSIDTDGTLVCGGPGYCEALRYVTPAELWDYVKYTGPETEGE